MARLSGTTPSVPIHVPEYSNWVGTRALRWGRGAWRGERGFGWERAGVWECAVAMWVGAGGAGPGCGGLSGSRWHPRRACLGPPDCMYATPGDKSKAAIGEM